jgi:hypothetical protein
MNGPHIQPNPGQGVHVSLEGAAGSHATHARYFSGTGAAIAHRADPAKTFE